MKIPYYIIGVALLAALLFGIGQRATVRRLTTEKERLQLNQQALLSRIERYRTDSGRSAIACQRLTLRHEELRAAKAELAAEVKALRIRLSRVESIAKTASRSELRFVAPLTDTMLVGMADSCPQRLLTWRDAWTEVRGCIRRDSAEVSILSRDTLVQIVHRVPHRWWFFRWGTRAIRQEVVSRNPHTQLVYTEYLRLE